MRYVKKTILEDIMVRDKMKRKGITYRQLAALLGFKSTGRLSDMLHGKILVSEENYNRIKNVIEDY